VARRGLHPSALGAAYQAGSTSTKTSRWCSTTSTTAGSRRLIVDHESLLGDPVEYQDQYSPLWELLEGSFMVCKARTRYTPSFRPHAYTARTTRGVDERAPGGGHWRGPSGVAAAVSLRDRGLHPLLMDRADEVGASWRRGYDRLKLNTQGLLAPT
jgi:hypothetical protein